MILGRQARQAFCFSTGLTPVRSFKTYGAGRIDGITEGLLSDRIDGIIRIILSLSHLPDEDEKTQFACLPCGIALDSTWWAGGWRFLIFIWKIRKQPSNPVNPVNPVG